MSSWTANASSIGFSTRAGRLCNCIGPQDGQPLCPCRMVHVRVVDGRYVETIDHGPVRPHHPMPRPTNPEIDGDGA